MAAKTDKNAQIAKLLTDLNLGTEQTKSMNEID